MGRELLGRRRPGRGTRTHLEEGQGALGGRVGQIRVEHPHRLVRVGQDRLQEVNLLVEQGHLDQDRPAGLAGQLGVGAVAEPPAACGQGRVGRDSQLLGLDPGDAPARRGISPPDRFLVDRRRRGVEVGHDQGVGVAPGGEEPPLFEELVEFQRLLHRRPGGRGDAEDVEVLRDSGILREHPADGPGGQPGAPRRGLAEPALGLAKPPERGEPDLRVDRPAEVLAERPEGHRLAAGEDRGFGQEPVGLGHRPVVGAGQLGHQKHPALDRRPDRRLARVLGRDQHVAADPAKPIGVGVRGPDGGEEPGEAVLAQPVPIHLDPPVEPRRDRFEWLGLGPRTIGDRADRGTSRAFDLRPRGRDRPDAQVVEVDLGLPLTLIKVDDQAFQVRPLQADRAPGRGPEDLGLQLDRGEHVDQLQLLPAVGRLEDRAGDHHIGRRPAVRVDVVGQHDPAQQLRPGAVRTEVEADLQSVRHRDVGQAVAVIEPAADPRLELEPFGHLALAGGAVGPLVGEDLHRGVGILLTPGDLRLLEAVAEDLRLPLGGFGFGPRPGQRDQRPDGQQACRPGKHSNDPVPHGTRDLPASTFETSHALGPRPIAPESTPGSPIRLGQCRAISRERGQEPLLLIDKRFLTSLLRAWTSLARAETMA